MKNFLSLGLVTASLLTGISAHADNLAFAGSSTGAFGVMDLNTGSFTSLGNSGQTLSGLAVAGGSLYAASYHEANGALFSVNPSSGSLTPIGSATGVTYDDFGSTSTGLYAVSLGATQNLYSINPTSGAATLVGPTGLSYGTWRGLSNGSDQLLFSDGPNLYSLNTSTGAASLIGALGGSAELGVLLSEGGLLYGGDDVNLTVDTINPSTGSATVGPHPGSGFSGTFYGLAQDPLTTSTPTQPTSPVPEPGTLGLLAIGGSTLEALRRRFQ